MTEYGVHWNFFFTLGLLPIFGAALERLAPLFDFNFLALIVCVGRLSLSSLALPCSSSTHTTNHAPFFFSLPTAHQLLLSLTPLQHWTLTAPRLSLLTQNREGIVSLIGYLSIYLFGIGTGLYVLPPDPYFYSNLHLSPSPNSTPESRKKLQEKKEKVWKAKPGKLANVLGSYSVIWWVAYLLSRRLGLEVSRRLVRCYCFPCSLFLTFSSLTHSFLLTFSPHLFCDQANLPYVLWITAHNTSFLFAYLLIHMWASSSPLTHSTTAPIILEAINRNGLVVFLVVRPPDSLPSPPPHRYEKS